MSRLTPLVVLVTLLTNCGGETVGASDATSAPSRSRCAGELEGPYVVAHVSDGDTIVIRTAGRRPTLVRLIGVDAPEVDGPHRRAETGGVEARSYASSLLSGQTVFIESDNAQGTRDRHGRRLAYVYRSRDCILVNGEIIRQGHGMSYRKFRYRHRELFHRYEREARAARRGLWK